MQFDLSGLRALVTGSTGGIGLAIAERLAANGAEVGVNGRTRERVEAAMQTLAPAGKVFPVVGDVGEAEGAKAILAAVGEVDILVNNAAWVRPKPLFEITDEDWMKSFEVNVVAGVRLARALAPRMREKGFGRIVFISSESAMQIPNEMVHYGTTKTAMLSAARGFAQALEGTGVTVNTVLPGPTRSEGFERFIAAARAQGRSEEDVQRDFFRDRRPTSLLKRFIAPREVADVVAFVCSREASAVTGAPIRADGGVILSST